MLDESLGQSTISTIGAPFGSATVSTVAKILANYQARRDLTLTGSLTYAHVDYVHDRRTDNDWSASAKLEYLMFRNFGVALQYEFTRVNSNAPLASYTRNVITLAGTYKY